MPEFGERENLKSGTAKGRYCKVKVMVWLCCVVPAVAVTVITEVLGLGVGVGAGVGVGLGAGAGAELAEPPQPVSSRRPRTIASTNRSATFRLREAPEPSQQNASKNPLALSHAPPLLKASGEELMVRVVVAAPPCGLTVAGEKLQVTPTGRFEQAKDTD